MLRRRDERYRTALSGHSSTIVRARPTGTLRTREEDCLADGSASATDDATALALLQTCGVSVSGVVSAIVTLLELTAGGLGAPVAELSTSVASPSTTSGGAPIQETGSGMSDMVAMVLDVTLTEEQAACIDASAPFSMIDTAEFAEVLEACGLDPSLAKS